MYDELQCCSKYKMRTLFYWTYRFITPSANEYCLHKEKYFSSQRS